MFAKQLPAGVFEKQREFIRAMEANLDFYWWAKSLIAEETQELKEAFEADKQDMAHIFKELADVVYVVAGFYNTLPNYGSELLNEGKNKDVIRIMGEAEAICAKVCQSLKIPLPLVVAAFEIVHASNMSKLDEKGNPVRRKDGKILKGPNYVAPDMQPVVKEWSKFRMKNATQGALDAKFSN